jgi:hypothetical protein
MGFYEAKFPVLIVENDARRAESMAQRVRALEPRIDVTVATDLNAAREAILTGFFQLGFFDLQLTAPQADALGGLDLAETVAKFRPTMRVVLMTNHVAGRYTGELLFKSLRPSGPNITTVLEGAIDRPKVREDEVVAEVVKRRLARWSGHPVSIEQHILEDAVARMGPRVDGWREDGVTDEARLRETSYCLARLFGQGRLTDTADHRMVLMEPLEGGLSGAATYRASLRSSAEDSGNWVVVKIGSRDTIEDERQRYEQFVRYDVDAGLRIELLAQSFGNLIGAVCYSLAGNAPSEIFPITREFRSRSETGLSIASQVFDRSTRHWYAMRGDDVSPISFFRDEFRCEFVDRSRGLSDSLVTAAPKQMASNSVDSYWKQDASWHVVSDALRVGTETISLPTVDQASLVDRLQQDLPTCVIHGDLHSGNLLLSPRLHAPNASLLGGSAGAVVNVTADSDAIGTDLTARFIDYASTGFGPRPLDVLTLSASGRLVDATEWGSIAEIVRAERALWDWVWAATTIDDPLRVVPKDRPYWWRLSAVLLLRLRHNFDGREGETALTMEEVASVGVMHGLRLSSLDWMKPEQTNLDGSRVSKGEWVAIKAYVRARIAAWMDPMVRSLSGPSR